MPSSPFSKPSHQKTPFIIHNADSIARFNKKYAPKYVNHLDIFSKEYLPLRTRYLKKVGSVRCPTDSLDFSNNMKSVVHRTLRRFSKYCKGNENLDPKILSTFSSLKICQFTNLFPLPLHFKLGKFPKLHLTLMKIPADRSLVSQQISKMLSNINRFKSLRDLSITFDEITNELLTLLVLQFKKYPLRLSSLQSFTLDYQSSISDDLTNFSSLANLKNALLPVTHLFIKAVVYEYGNLDLHNFKNLMYLSLDIVCGYEDPLFRLKYLETLINLETFIFKTSIQSSSGMKNFLTSFQSPKSVKTLSLTLTIKTWPLSIEFLQQNQKAPSKRSFFSNFIRCFSMKKSSPQERYQVENFFEEEWDLAKEFYERWSTLDRLSRLTLDVQTSPLFAHLSLFFLAPILKRCQNLRSLTLSTQCLQHSLGRSFTHRQRFLQWSHLLQALELSKDTLENIDLATCNIEFDHKIPPDFIFNNLKKLNLNIKMMETNSFPIVHNIIPKTLEEFQFDYNLTIKNDQDMKQLCAYLKQIPKSSKLHVNIRILKKNSKIFQKGLIRHLPSVQIEGHIHLMLHTEGGFKVKQLKDSLIKKGTNVAPTGYLKISHGYLTTIFESKKIDVQHCFS